MKIICPHAVHFNRIWRRTWRDTAQSLPWRIRCANPLLQRNKWSVAELRWPTTKSGVTDWLKDTVPIKRRDWSLDEVMYQESVHLVEVCTAWLHVMHHTDSLRSEQKSLSILTDINITFRLTHWDELKWIWETNVKIILYMLFDTVLPRILNWDSQIVCKVYPRRPRTFFWL